MRARTHTAALGEGGRVVAVHAEVSPGLPGLAIRGLSTAQLERAGMRVRCALAHCGHLLAGRNQIVEPGSADVGPGIDLALAGAVLVGHGVISAKSLAGTLLWGQLAADGSLEATPGTSLAAELARAAGLRRVIVSAASSHEIADASGLDVWPVAHLANLVARLRGELPLEFGESSRLALAGQPDAPDMLDLRGMARARAAVEIMIAGRHHTRIRSSAGAESAMLIERLAGLIPEPDESLAAVRIELASRVAHPLTAVQILDPRTDPEHLLERHRTLPGPAGLAHGGVLVLDDLRRTPMALLDAVSDVVHGVWRERPAEFAVLAFDRPSKAKRDPAGRLGHDFGLFADLEPPGPSDVAGDSTEGIRTRIATARLRQHQRFRARSPTLEWTFNGRIPCTPSCLDEFCPTSESGRAVLDLLTNHLRWTDFQRGTVLRMARTLADLDPNRDPTAPLDRECIASAAMFTARP